MISTIFISSIVFALSSIQRMESIRFNVKTQEKTYYNVRYHLSHDTLVINDNGNVFMIPVDNTIKIEQSNE